MLSLRKQIAFGPLALTLGIALSVAVTGCSKQPTADVSPAAEAESSAAAADAAAAEQVVSQFLDRVRRGGDLNDASRLLTDLARSELQRIGQPIQPIGSPDATFTITRSEAVAAGEPIPHRLVHCLWSEPIVDETGRLTGGRESYQVVWSVARQSEGWRISGMVIEMSPDEPPMVLDFENGEAMAMLLGGTAETQTAQTPETIR